MNNIHKHQKLRFHSMNSKVQEIQTSNKISDIMRSAGKGTPKLKLVQQSKDSKESSFVFEFAAQQTRDSCKDFIIQSRNHFKMQERVNATKSTSVDQGKITAEMRMKLKVLANNPELKQLWDELVKTGVVSDKEFWEVRKVIQYGWLTELFVSNF
jgi:dsRNA-specific ribonuclease